MNRALVIKRAALAFGLLAAGKPGAALFEKAMPIEEIPAATTWVLYPESSHLFIDGGTLELGIIRDSVLNQTNNYQVFRETYEQVVLIENPLRLAA